MIWKTINDFPDYEISSTGEVRRKTNVSRGKSGAIISQFAYRSGYLNVHLSNGNKRKHFRVNRLVCEHFNGPAPSKHHHAAHKNGCKTDNNYTNLYWATAVENAMDREDHGNTPRGEKNGRATLNEEIVRKMREMFSEGMSFSEIADELSTSHGAAYCAITRRSWKHVL